MVSAYEVQGDAIRWTKAGTQDNLQTPSEVGG